MIKPRVGFLGVGWIGRNRMQAIMETDAVEAAAVSDPSGECVAEALKIAPEAETAAGLEEMLALGLDGVVIATPSALHAEQTIQALRAGAAVFCQKPLGRDDGEVSAAVEAAREADRLLAVDLSYRHTAGMQAIAPLVRSGALGEVFAVDLVFHNAYGPDKPWFYDRGLAGGGCLIDLGVHLVDLALWTLGFPEVGEPIAADLRTNGRPTPRSGRSVEDYATAQFRLASGALVRLACSWNLHAGREAVIAAAFFGTEGGAALRNVNGSFYDFTAERFSGTSTEVLASPPDEWGGRAAADWAWRLAAGERFDTEAERLVDVARVLDRIYGR